jgi:hypothetical protein
MAFLSALPSGGVCAVFMDAQLVKTSEATSNTVVTWSFMAFLNAKFLGHSQSFRASADLKSLVCSVCTVGANRRRFSISQSRATATDSKSLGAEINHHFFGLTSGVPLPCPIILRRSSLGNSISLWSDTATISARSCDGEVSCLRF